MSNTGDEHEQSGSDHPDSEGGSHHGQDGGRDTLTAGEAQRAGALGEGDTQDLPAMSQNNATIDEKVAGIVDQCRQDLANGSREPVEDMLRARLSDAGVDVSDEFVRALAARVEAG